MEDDDLADAFRTGSAEGFRAVYERYSGAVYAIALRILGDRELGADAVQVTFLNAWRACGSLEPGRPPACSTRSSPASTASGPRRRGPRARWPSPGSRQAGATAAGPIYAERSGPVPPHCWLPPRS
jgi:Sigma-70 region 2